MLKKDPFHCSAKMLRETMGFSAPKPRETEQGATATGADNAYARAVMEECEHQELLANYRIEFRTKDHSPPVSPKTVKHRPDWIFGDKCNPCGQEAAEQVGKGRRRNVSLRRNSTRSRKPNLSLSALQRLRGNSAGRG